MFNEVAYEDKRLHRLRLSEKDAENVYECWQEMFDHFHLLKIEEKRVEKCLQAEESAPSSALLPPCFSRTFQSTFYLLELPRPLDGNKKPSSIGKGSCLEEGTRLHFYTHRLRDVFQNPQLSTFPASLPTSTLHHLLLPPLTLVHPSANIVLRLSTTFVTSTRSFQKLSLPFQVTSIGKSQNYDFNPIIHLQQPFFLPTTTITFATTSIDQADTLAQIVVIMSANNRAAMTNSSPQSAGEVTHQDTPSTNYTVFSPEAGGSTGKRDKNKSKAPLALAPIVRESTVTSIQ